MLGRWTKKSLGVRRKRDSPEIARLIVILDKLDSVGVFSLHGADLRHDARTDAHSSLVLHEHGRPHQQLASYLQSCSMAVQIGSVRGEAERGLRLVVGGESYSCIESDTAASALRDLIAATDD